MAMSTGGRVRPAATPTSARRTTLTASSRSEWPAWLRIVQPAGNQAVVHCATLQRTVAHPIGGQHPVVQRADEVPDAGVPAAWVPDASLPAEESQDPEAEPRASVPGPESLWGRFTETQQNWIEVMIAGWVDRRIAPVKPTRIDRLVSYQVAHGLKASGDFDDATMRTLVSALVRSDRVMIAAHLIINRYELPFDPAAMTLKLIELPDFEYGIHQAPGGRLNLEVCYSDLDTEAGYAGFVNRLWSATLQAARRPDDPAILSGPTVHNRSAASLAGEFDVAVTYAYDRADIPAEPVASFPAAAPLEKIMSAYERLPESARTAERTAAYHRAVMDHVLAGWERVCPGEPQPWYSTGSQLKPWVHNLLKVSAKVPAESQPPKFRRTVEAITRLVQEGDCPARVP